MFEIYGAPKKRKFKVGDVVCLLEKPSKPRLTVSNDKKKNEYIKSLLKKYELFYKLGMVGIIKKIDKKNGTYEVEFSKKMDLPIQNKRPIRTPPKWEKKSRLKRTFTYPFSHVAIYEKIRLLSRDELELHNAKLRRNQLKKSISKKKKMMKEMTKKRKPNTPRLQKDIDNAISILDDALQGLNRNGLEKLSDGIRGLDDEINELLSGNSEIESPVQFLISRKKSKNKRK